jgi:hypothetical protein
MKPIKLYTDLSFHLYEGEAAKKRGAPTPTYLTQWKIVGNSEVHGQEIWSCGEYNSTDGKYHILVQPLGGSIADIALDAPLRKVNDVADTIEFPSDTEGKALVTRNLDSLDISNVEWENARYPVLRFQYQISGLKDGTGNYLCAKYESLPAQTLLDNSEDKSIWVYNTYMRIRDEDYAKKTSEEFRQDNIGVEVIYELATPTTELVDAPQIQEADSYSCVIRQGAKAVSWSSFETE